MRLSVLMFFIQIVRLVCYKISACFRQCRNTAAQMWIPTSIQNFLTSLNRSKKVFLLILVLCAIILYAWPSWIPLGSPRMGIDPLTLCVDAKMNKHATGLENYDVLINYTPDRPDVAREFLPYIGNGYIGSSVDPQSHLYIKYGRALSVPINYYPIINVNVEGPPTSEARALILAEGMVYRTQCFEMQSVCISASSQYYAHRTRPSIIVQEFRIENPTSTPVTADLELAGVSGWTGAKTVKKQTNTRRGETDYTISTGYVPLEESSQGLVFVVAIATLQLTETVTIKDGGTWKQHVLTAVKYTEQPVSPTGINIDKDRLAEEAEKELLSALEMDNKMLREEHIKSWKDLWSSGFGISESKAASALNGDKINSTMYYVMSNLASPIHEINRAQEERVSLLRLLYFPDRCYDGHQTLQNTAMWPEVTTTDSLVDLVKTWIITLEKQGCSTMLKAGADGAIQAMILSFGALKFSNDHLEFNTLPKDLHRDYFFRRINYGNNTHVNISVIVGEDNKALLFSSLDKSDKHYFACDAGCVDPMVQLSKEVAQFPVKKTDPPTAILYITADQQHMTELKHSIHVQEIMEAPAHEHHVIALHRHGHHYGGLPMLFWVSIGILISIFHLFLLKLVYNEYCQGSDARFSRGRYSL